MRYFYSMIVFVCDLINKNTYMILKPEIFSTFADSIKKDPDGSFHEQKNSKGMTRIITRWSLSVVMTYQWSLY